MTSNGDNDNSSNSPPDRANSQDEVSEEPAVEPDALDTTRLRPSIVSIRTSNEQDAGTEKPRQQQHRASEPEVLVSGLLDASAASLSIRRDSAEVRLMAKELHDQERRAKKESRGREEDPVNNNAQSVSVPTVAKDVTVPSTTSAKSGLARRLPQSKFGGAPSSRSAGVSTATSNPTSLPGAYANVSPNVTTGQHPRSRSTSEDETKEEEEGEREVPVDAHENSQAPLIEATLVPQSSQSAVDAPAPPEASNPQVLPAAVEADKVELRDLLQNRRLQCFILVLILVVVLVVAAVVWVIAAKTEGEEAPQLVIAATNTVVPSSSPSESANNTAMGDYQLYFPPDLMTSFQGATGMVNGPSVEDFAAMNQGEFDMNPYKRIAFADMMEQVTLEFAPEANRTNVVTTCFVDDLMSTVNFTMLYSSASINVSQYPFLFYQHVITENRARLEAWLANSTTTNNNNNSATSNPPTSSGAVFTMLRYYGNDNVPVELDPTKFTNAGGTSMPMAGSSAEPTASPLLRKTATPSISPTPSLATNATLPPTPNSNTPTYTPTISSQPSQFGYVGQQVYYRTSMLVDHLVPDQYLTVEEEDIFCSVLRNYTGLVAGREARLLNTKCSFNNQRIEFMDNGTIFLDAIYSMWWDSCYLNTTSQYPVLFLEWQRGNQQIISQDFRAAGFPATLIGDVGYGPEKTPDPYFVYGPCPW